MSKTFIVSLALVLGACQQQDLLVGTWRSGSIASDSNLASASSELVFLPETRETNPDGSTGYSYRFSATDRLIWSQQSPTTPGCAETYRLSSEKTSYSNAGYAIEIQAREPGFTVERSGCLRATDNQPASAAAAESTAVSPAVVGLFSMVIAKQLIPDVGPNLIPSRLDENNLVIFAKQPEELAYTRIAR